MPCFAQNATVASLRPLVVSRCEPIENRHWLTAGTVEVPFMMAVSVEISMLDTPMLLVWLFFMTCSSCRYPSTVSATVAHGS
jgi:hypothetical protein